MKRIYEVGWCRSWSLGSHFESSAPARTGAPVGQDPLFTTGSRPCEWLEIESRVFIGWQRTNSLTNAKLGLAMRVATRPLVSWPTTAPPGLPSYPGCQRFLWATAPQSARWCSSALRPKIGGSALKWYPAWKIMFDSSFPSGWPIWFITTWSWEGILRKKYALLSRKQRVLTSIFCKAVT